MASDPQLNQRLANLKAQIARLEEQIRWTVALANETADPTIPQEVRDRAFSGSPDDSIPQTLQSMKQEIDRLLQLVQGKD